MSNQLTKVRLFLGTTDWIVEILGNTLYRYVQPDGTEGPRHLYPTERAAERAEALFLKLNPNMETSAGREKRTCSDCALFNPKAQGNCDTVGYGTLPTNNPCDRFKPKASAVERELVLHPAGTEIRKFETGATRDTVKGKLDYMKALSPIVLRRYVEYLDKHRLQPDGRMRDFDNWKKGIPQETYHSSGGRHFFTSWLLFEGYEAFDNHGPVDEEDALCGRLFNTMGRLHEILKAKLNAASDRINQQTEDIEIKGEKMGNPIRVYVSHSIRGKKGAGATNKDMQQNNNLAIMFGQSLRRKFPRVDFYIPGEHDEFVLTAYRKEYLNEKQILNVDCTIVQKCNFVIAFSPDGYLSRGMKIEIEYAGENGIPVIVISKLDKTDINIITRQLQELKR